jgi:hypothetical protein
MKRELCVICENKEFECINSFSNFPIMATSSSGKQDILFDYTLILCNRCKCLQLENLVDAKYLYSPVYMNATFSPSWLDHHKTFCQFIVQNTTETSFLEIGANTGILYKIMLDYRSIDYTTLDMYKNNELHSNIKFIEGNCEDFDYNGYNTVILSHVFEHLYNPRKFIEKIKNGNVSSVFISIPNFDLLVKEKAIITIHSQHTFFCGLDYIKYVFSLYHYRCETSFTYNGNFKSYMLKFVLDPNMLTLELPFTDKNMLTDIYVNEINRISNTKLSKNTLICPAGIYGQYLYYFIKDKENVLGFIDNNKNRHGKPLYGTDKLVYSPTEIDYKNNHILLCECPYKDEILESLSKISSNIKFS